MEVRTNSIEKTIIANLTEFLHKNQFVEWMSKQKANDGDYIFFNNCFIYRERFVKTKKNKSFLGAKISNNSLDLSTTVVATPNDFDGDFKVFSSKDKTITGITTLIDAIQNENLRIGQLIFFLIGELIDNPITIPIASSDIPELRYDNRATSQDIIVENGKSVFIVNQLRDPEGAWNSAIMNLNNTLGNKVSAFEKTFFTAFEKLRKEVRVQLLLPKPCSQRKNNTFISQLLQSIVSQRKDYEASLTKYLKEQEGQSIHLRELLRISYNFADDAIKILQLLVSICDLKPILFWQTLCARYDVVDCFRNLPLSTNDNKGDPNKYREKVNGARNKAFHNLLLFDRTIEADLNGITMNARKLTLFPEYGQRKTTVALDYEDRELIEILKEFSRAEETLVAQDFWEKNLSLIVSFEKLLEDTENALWDLNNARKNS